MKTLNNKIQEAVENLGGTFKLDIFEKPEKISFLSFDEMKHFLFMIDNRMSVNTIQSKLAAIKNL